jgi:hypothetical protein
VAARADYSRRENAPPSVCCPIGVAGEIRRGSLRRLGRAAVHGDKASERDEHDEDDEHGKRLTAGGDNILSAGRDEFAKGERRRWDHLFLTTNESALVGHFFCAASRDHS